MDFIRNELIIEFIDKFFPYPTRISKKDEKHGWLTFPVSSKLSIKIYREHLEEKAVYGINLGSYCKPYFCLDFDQQKGKPKEDYYQLITHVCSIFQCPKLILTSSTSNNIHAYFFIKRMNPYIIYDLVAKALAYNSIYLAPGYVELYTSRNLRLPLGRGSFLVDKEFNKIENPKEVQLFMFLQNLTAAEKVSIYEAIPQQYRTFKLSLGVRSCVPSIDELLETGLTRYGMRNQAFLEYAVFLARQGQTEEGIKNRLIEFIDKHGHMSKEYRQSPEKVYEKAGSVAKTVYTKNVITDNSFKDLKVETELCIMILNKFRKYGLKTQLKVFSLLQYVKKKTIINKNYIAISKKFLINNLGLSSKTYKTVIEDLVEEDLILPISYGNNLKKHSTIYKWIGPELDRNVGYESYINFIVENKYYNKYTYYNRNSIIRFYNKDKCHLIIQK